MFNQQLNRLYKHDLRHSVSASLCVRFALVRFALVRFALVRFALVRFAHPDQDTIVPSFFVTVFTASLFLIKVHLFL
jgi:hypothetical protein